MRTRKNLVGHMRKVVLFMHLSLDGFCATPDGGLDWISYDDELQNWADDIIKNIVGSPLYGRVTYELMKYWQTVLTDPNATKHDMEHAQWLENVEKIVFSKTLKKEDWNNTTVISGSNLTEEVGKLKKQPGKDLVIFGSPSLAREFIDLGLIDEYQLSVSPVILGSGKTAFHDIMKKVKLKLLRSQILKSGVATLHYEAIK
ncbi:MAG TPA: dihydrofolate reductase family protein [Patescibacteria group bacterium]